MCRSGSFDVTEDQFFTRQFLSLKVRCYYSNAGCKWTGELRQLDEHEKKCKRDLVTCQYCSENYHCGDINEHLVTCRKVNASVTCPLGYEHSSQDHNIDPFDYQCPAAPGTSKNKVCFQTNCCGNHICSDCATQLKSTKSPCALFRAHSHKSLL